MARKAGRKKEEVKKAEETEEQPVLEERVDDTAPEQEVAEPVEVEEPEVVEEEAPSVVEEPEPEEVELPAETEATDEVAAVPEEAQSERGSVKAETHARSRKSKFKARTIPNKWQKIFGLGVGAAALVALVVSGISSQYFKGKTMPNVSVAGVSSAAKKPEQLRHQLQAQKDQLAVSFKSGEKQFDPKQEEIGYQVDVDKTVENALKAKRERGVLGKIAFWQKVNVPAVVSINDTLLNQYIETNLPELIKPPLDSQLQFDAKQGAFVITPQADGEGADMAQIKQQLEGLANTMQSRTIEVKVATKKPPITEKKLQPLVEPANALVVRRVVLTGLGYSFQARPADIAVWITPTPKEDGSMELVIDPAKVQSYVDSISKRVSNAPQDRKILKDETTGQEVVIQQGRAGTELANKQTLAITITEALKKGQDSAQTMNITTAAYQTVNMEAYEKWIEVDLSEQRTTAYERATPVRNFIIASGTKGHETVTGEFAIWLKVRKQTMQGGSRADGSYYSIPNVEWVSYFYKDYALHGAWWREKFGAPASHGCVNMTNADAKWLYEWAPMGTKVIVHQ